MCHGFIDGTPGHAEFWKRFRDKHDMSWRRKDYKPTWKARWKHFKWIVYGRQRLRIGLLQRLWHWNSMIRKLMKANPGISLSKAEQIVGYHEVFSICRNMAIACKGEKND